MNSAYEEIEYPEDQRERATQIKAKQGLEGMSSDDLRRLKSRIDDLLPDSSLKSLNLESELLQQYQRVLRLQEEVLHDQDCPANQRAQVAGQVGSTLQHLIKLQEDLSLTTTLRAMEEALIESLQLLPEEARKAYFVEYERLSRSKGL